MANFSHANQAFHVIDLVQDSIVPNSDSPNAVCPRKQFGSRRTRLGAQLRNRRLLPQSQRFIPQFLKKPLSRWPQYYPVPG